MTEFLPLPIFPSSLASSVVTTVLVGVFVVGFFNLRFGWVFSGLVVPGYLVPLLLVKPWAALVIFLEGAVTYLIIWAYSEQLSRFGFWGSLFGRDRFFAIVLVSIGVRLLMDGMLLPLVGQWVNEGWNLSFDYQHNLHSFGLVIVALLANTLWKPGFLRGAPALGVMIGITYLIVRFVLMELTNFSVSNLAYIYEEIATSMLASPKAYIILIITSFVASRMNLLYGWDFSGILIPSLLALEWYDPLKILASFFEAFVVLGLAVLVLRLPIFKGVTMEAARKTLLFFSVSFVYKLVLGYGFDWFAPEVKASDYYGFGYLLPTLLATKMHDKALYARLPSITLQTSVVAVGFASIVGFALTFVPSFWNFRVTRETTSHATWPEQKWSSLPETGPEGALRQKIHLYASVERKEFAAPSAQELQLFEDALRELQEFLRTQQPAPFARARLLLSRIGYEAFQYEDGFLQLTETDPRRGWGSYLFNRRSPDGPVLEVPYSIDEDLAYEAALELGRGLGASAWGFAGASRRAAYAGESDPLRSRRLVFHRFHRVFGGERTLQVRTSEATPEASRDPVVLWIKRAVPNGLNLRGLQDLVGSLRIHWREPVEKNLQRLASYSGFAELYLSKSTTWELAGRAYSNLAAKGAGQNLSTARQAVAKSVLAADANTFRAPSLASLVYFDRQFLTPLFRGGLQTGALSQLRLQVLAGTVANLNGSMNVFRDENMMWVALEKAGGGEGGGWFALHLRETPRVIVQVPHPVRDVGALELAEELHRELPAAALIIAGARPDTNNDGSADVLKLSNKRSFFTLVSQVYFRECRSDPATALQVRALSGSAANIAQTDAVVSRSVFGNHESLSTSIQQLIRLLQQRNLSYLVIDGPPPFISAEPDSTPTGFYLSETENKELVDLWISPQVRQAYAQRSGSGEGDSALEALGIGAIVAEVESYLSTSFTTETFENRPELESLLLTYLGSRNVVVLHTAQQRWPAVRLIKLTDSVSRREFLLAHVNDRCRMALNLNALRKDLIIRASTADEIKPILQRFLQQDAALLAGEGKP